MSRTITFGEIEGIKEGYWFEGRKEMMPTSFHRNWGAGIDGNGTEGTAAIVLSGGYEDDLDQGDEIIYTGAGGKNLNTRKQVENQSWKTPGNAGLLLNMYTGLPVRLIRGSDHKSDLSPKTGYLYAGLYSVVNAWEEVGKSGFTICRFRLVYSGQNEKRRTHDVIKLEDLKRDKRRNESTVLRIVRDTVTAQKIKRLYNFECQVCQVIINTRSGKYAEGAHIRPLGLPHDGDDNSDNLICLCPNHHVMFDKGVFSIMDNLELIGDLTGRLFTHQIHKLNKCNLQYHRKYHGYN